MMSTVLKVLAAALAVAADGSSALAQQGAPAAERGAPPAVVRDQEEIIDAVAFSAAVGGAAKALNARVGSETLAAALDEFTRAQDSGDTRKLLDACGVLRKELDGLKAGWDDEVAKKLREAIGLAEAAVNRADELASEDPKSMSPARARKLATSESKLKRMAKEIKNAPENSRQAKRLREEFRREMALQGDIAEGPSAGGFQASLFKDAADSLAAYEDRLRDELLDVERFAVRLDATNEFLSVFEQALATSRSIEDAATAMASLKGNGKAGGPAEAVDRVQGTLADALGILDKLGATKKDLPGLPNLTPKTITDVELDAAINSYAGKPEESGQTVAGVK